MKKFYFLLFLSIGLSGCATKVAYLNTNKTFEEVKQDQTSCQAKVDASDFKDPSLKQNKLEECMKENGYKVVTQEEAEKLQGFKGLWIKPGADFKPYEAAFIEEVDLSSAQANASGVPDTKTTQSDIANLGAQMHKRFSSSLAEVMPVVENKEQAQGKKVLYIILKLNKISQNNVGLSVVLEAAGNFSPVPLPDAPEGIFAFEGEIIDRESKEKLITISDEVSADKNSSLVGTEKFSQWQKAYNVMDYWADHLAELLAKERQQEYKSRLGMKIF